MVDCCGQGLSSVENILQDKLTSNASELEGEARWDGNIATSYQISHIRTPVKCRNALRVKAQKGAYVEKWNHVVHSLVEQWTSFYPPDVRREHQ